MLSFPPHLFQFRCEVWFSKWEPLSWYTALGHPNFSATSLWKKDTVFAEVASGTACLYRSLMCRVEGRARWLRNILISGAGNRLIETAGGRVSFCSSYELGLCFWNELWVWKEEWRSLRWRNIIIASFCSSTLAKAHLPMIYSSYLWLRNSCCTAVSRSSSPLLGVAK